MRASQAAATIAFCACACLWHVVGAASGVDGGAGKPNILHIVADDLGFNELNFANATRGLITPNLDALANSGVWLRNFHVQPICSPTRSALMTGRYPIRLGTQSSVIFWDTPWAIDLNETFLPQNMKDAGYATRMFGKWHLGIFRNESLPGARGFDHASGFIQGCESYWGHVAADCNHAQPPPPPELAAQGKNYDGYDWMEDGVVDTTANGTYSSFLIRDKAVAYLKSRAAARAAAPEEAQSPFYMYLPFQDVHAPLQAPWQYVNMYPNVSGDMKILMGMISALDDAIGSVIAALKESGEADNTIIFFHSDNGAPPNADKTKNGYTEQRNYPLRGWKTQIWEGGTRVLAFVNSPLLPKEVQGTVTDELYHVTDLLPTIVGLAGGSVSRNRPLDGHDVWESITTRSASPRTEMLYNINPLLGGQAGPPKAGLRHGDWKLLCEHYDSSTHQCEGTRYLFNITADPTESNEVSRHHGDVVKQLEARMATYSQGAAEPMQWTPPYQGASYYCASCPLGNVTQPYNAWRPWYSP